MGVGPTAHSARKISEGSWKYRKGVDHRKEGIELERGVAKWCRAMYTDCTPYSHYCMAQIELQSVEISNN